MQAVDGTNKPDVSDRPTETETASGGRQRAVVDLVDVLTRYPVQVASSVAVGRPLPSTAGGAPTAARLRAAALAVVLIGVAAVFRARPVAERRRS